MKTILFIDQGEGELWHSFVEHDFLLKDWFCEENVVVCPWHSEGRSAKEALPDLPSLLGDEQDWNALVVTDLRGAKVGQRAENDLYFGNPYDFPENYDVDFTQPLLESDRPIVRLTQMLGGIPDRTTVVDASEYKVIHPRSEAYFDMLERYRLEVPRPRRLVCVTPRDLNEDLAHELACRREDEKSSMAGRFWERNAYAVNTRYVVVDFDKDAIHEDLDDGSSTRAAHDYLLGKSWLGYWMVVLTLAMNEFSTSDLQAFKLYVMSVSLNHKQMDEDLARCKAIWLAALDLVRAHVDMEKNRTQVSEFESQTLPNYRNDIPVQFDNEDASNTKIRADHIGLFRDDGQNDVVTWAKELKESGAALKKLLVSPRNKVRMAVILFHGTEMPEDQVLGGRVLSQTQKEQLEEELFSIEMGIADGVAFEPFSFESRKREMNDAASNVEEALRSRSQSRPTIAVVAFGALSLTLGLLPLGAQGFKNSLVAVGVGIICCVCFLLVVVVGVLAIMWQRKRVEDAYAAFNDQMQTTCDKLLQDAKRVSKNISDCSSFMRGWHILQRRQNSVRSTDQLAWLCDKEAVLDERIKSLDQLLGQNHPVDRGAYRTLMARGWQQVSLDLNDEMFFLLHLIDPVSRPLNAVVQSGSMVIVPFAFVSGITLLPVALRGYVVPSSAEGGESC